jgi:hypothetical protein
VTERRRILDAVMRVVLASARLGGRTGRAARAAVSGTCLGLLSEDQLRGLDERYYDVEELYRTPAWNERGLTWWEQEEIERSFAGRSRIVVAACGGGREVLALLAGGYDAVGYEPHPALRAFAESLLRAHGQAGRALAAERDQFPGHGPCDGVLVGWGAYGLIAPRERRVGFLRDAAAATAPGGPVMLSFFHRSVHGRDLRVTARMAGWLRRRRGGPPVEIGDTLAPSRVHVFTREELEHELLDAGLVLGSYRVLMEADPVTSYACAIGLVP